MTYCAFAYAFSCVYMHICTFILIFSNHNVIYLYDRLIDQACWKLLRRPLRRGFSPSSLVCIFYSKISGLKRKLRIFTFLLDFDFDFFNHFLSVNSSYSKNYLLYWEFWRWNYLHYSVLNLVLSLMTWCHLV